MRYELVVRLVDAGLCRLGRWGFASGRSRLLRVVVVDVEIVVSRGVVGLFGAFHFGLEFLDYMILNQLATGRVDRMGDVGVQLGTSVRVVGHPIGSKRRAALVAVLGAKMIFRSAARTVMYLTHLTHLNRECPSLPCDAVFEDCEWMSVWKVTTKEEIPKVPPPLSEFMALLTRLGGYNNRPTEPPPGPKTVWVGIRRMCDFATARLAFGPKQATCV